MDRTTLWFLKASLTYFFIAAILGVVMGVWPQTLMLLRTTHVHLNLVGWISMMIYGVGYHILPRFSGRPLRYPQWPLVQFYAANLGLWGMVAGFVLRATPAAGLYQPFLAVFGTLEFLAMSMFAVNIVRTIP
jgi:cbb3-type cytochrome oxidase subunit 1